MSRLDEIRARLAAATPGPWKSWIEGQEGAWGGSPGVMVPATSGGDFIEAGRPEDAEFIAHAPADIAYLLSLLGEPG